MSMDTPCEVLIHNDLLGLKGAKATLLAISPAGGFYEVNLFFGDRRHRTLLPIGRSIVIAAEPEEQVATVGEIER
jgi:hypothetical protein